MKLVKESLNESLSSPEFRELYPVGSEVYFHGETGEIIQYDGEMVIVYFSSMYDEQAIDIDELIFQNE